MIVQKKLAALQTLELYNCDVTQTDEYRDKIFELLDSVLYVDGFDRDGEPAPDEDEVDDYDGEGTHTDTHTLVCLTGVIACLRIQSSVYFLLVCPGFIQRPLQVTVRPMPWDHSPICL